MLAVAFGQPPKRAFRLGYTAGVAHYLASLYWLAYMPVAFVPILAWMALSAFLALYPATWVWLCRKLFPVLAGGHRVGDEEKNDEPSTLTGRIPATTWAQRVVWALTCAAVWVALELTVAHFLSGFPWNLLGASQFRLAPLIQISAFTGVYGVSFLVVWSSVSMLCAAMMILRQPAMRSAWAGEIFLPLAVVGLVYGWGYLKLLRPPPVRPTVSVALVQPGVPQKMIWAESENARRLEDLLALSRQALASHPDVLIWPESGLPGMVRFQEEIAEPVAQLAQSNMVWIIFAADDATPKPGAATLENADYYNASFLMTPGGRLAAEYRKRQLVMFGEFVPLVRWLPFMKYLTPIPGGFTPGDRAVPFELTSLKLKVSVLICFEDVFPHLVREYVSEDTDFLVNLTNDGWFGEGPAQWQQAACAVFRAVENGVPLVRCSNTGVTGWVDEFGRVRQVFEDGPRGIYGPGFLLAKIPVLAPGEKRAPTYYHDHGDQFAFVCAGISLLRFLRCWWGGRREKVGGAVAVSP